jgi:large subunit ribosomal protein L10
MNRDQKAVAIAEIAAQIDESSAIFAVDYRGISVAQVAELRSKLREADAVFKVVKNSLTERAADQVGVDSLKEYLAGPTALTFVHGDVAMAAKALADYGRTSQLLPFKGGMMEGAPLDVEQIRALSKLPSREVLYGQLVGVVASPISGLVRTLNALVGGLAVALGQVRDKKESGEIPAGDPPAAAAPVAEPPAEEPAAEPAVEESSEGDAPAEAATPEDAPAAEEASKPEEPAAEDVTQADPEAQADVQDAPENQAEPEKAEPVQDDDNQADAAAEVQSEDAEAKPTKED